nr:class I SAM-dependent methyltransferase [bacterium]
MKIMLKPGEHVRIAAGHPWVYDNEIAGEKGTAQDGIADVYSSGGHFIGRGFYNPASRIRVRVATWKEEELDQAFFARAIARADDRRKSQGYDGSYRAIYAESDDLPGLIVDKFGDYLCVQMLSLGMAQREKMLVDLLCQRFAPKGILARNDVPVRQKEGLAQEVRLLYGQVPQQVEIQEGDMRMLAQPYQGQKTGYFLDQRDNHAAAARHARGRVLDAFSYMGGFAIACALAGADEVTAVDISPQAVEAIRQNAALNGVHHIKTQAANCFDLLSSMDKTGISF